jgi:hypothetical protein
MAERVKIGISFQILQGTFKIIQISFGFFPSFEKGRIVRILIVHQMNGTQDKIKRIREDQIMVLHTEIGLQPQLDADTKIDLFFVLFLQRQEPAKVILRVKFKDHIAVRKTLQSPEKEVCT